MSDMEDNEPLTLKEACKLYPRSRLTVSTLRAESGRGRLDIFRLGKRDYTTAKSMREMVQRCQDAARRRAFTSIDPEDNGLSETERASSALDALNMTAKALRQNSANTSGTRTSRRAARIQ